MWDDTTFSVQHIIKTEKVTIFKEGVFCHFLCFG